MFPFAVDSDQNLEDAMFKTFKNSRSYLLGGFLISFFFFLLLDPESILESGRNALDLCLNIIIPSLFPFFVVSGLIMNTGVIHAVSRFFSPVMKPVFNLPGSAAFPLIAGWFSGYPAGAKYTVDLLEKGLLSKNEAQRLLAFCNNSGPLFIVGAIGTGYFQSPRLGLVLLLSHILASVTIGVAAGLISRKKAMDVSGRKAIPESKRPEFNGRILSDAVLNSVMVLLQICGTIFFFAIVVQIMENSGVMDLITNLTALITGQNNLYSDISGILLAGSLEITYGLFILSQAVNIPLNSKMLLAAMLCGFGGFSVHMQVTGLCPSGLRFKSYYMGKLFHGILAAIYTGLFLINQSIPVMNSGAFPYGTNILRLLMPIYILMLALITFFIIISARSGSP